MRSTWDEMARDMNDLSVLVDSIAPANEVLSQHASSELRQYLNIRRRFDHAAFIVALYAAFEKFVENLVGSYARLMAARTAYHALPETLRKKHLTKSAEILARGRLSEGRYASITEKRLVENLFNCLSTSNPYALNEIAITSHEQNLRVSQVNELFSALEIKQVTEQARKADPMTQWFRVTKDLGSSDEILRTTDLEKRLDDIVERRNQVAHRGGNPDELLGVEDMREAAGFLSAYTRSLFEVTVAAYLKAHCVDAKLAIPLELLEGPYENGHVVVVARPNHRVHVQQAAFSLGQQCAARWGRIQGIKVNDRPVSSIDTDSTAQTIGLELDFQCTRTRALYLLPHEDDNVWEPTSESAHRG